MYNQTHQDNAKEPARLIITLPPFMRKPNLNKDDTKSFICTRTASCIIQPVEVLCSVAGDLAVLVVALRGIRFVARARDDDVRGSMLALKVC